MKYNSQKLKINRISYLFLIIVFCAFKVMAQKTVVWSDSDSKTSISGSKKVWKHSTKNGQNSFNIEYKGDIEITDDDRDIKGISSGGYIEISKTTFGSKREILIEATSGGLRREYYEGRTKTDWEPAGKNWLAEILPEIVRSTGIAAESRVNRFFKQGGVNAVLNEISRLDGSYVKTTYARLLIEKDNISNSDLKKIITGISDEINSDYYLSSILKDNSKRFLKNDDTAETFFDAVQNISSDYYASVVLKEALKSHPASERSITKIMEANKNISSDYYASTVLTTVLEQENLNGPMLDEIIDAARNIHSDHLQSQVLAKAMEKDGLSSQSFRKLISAVSDVSSDYYMASVFANFVEKDLDVDTNVEIIKLIREKMSSDYYASTVLSKMLKKQELSPKMMEEMALTIANINSGIYASSVIKGIANRDISESNLIILIKAIGNINSDYYMASALESIAPTVNKSTSQVKEAYRVAAKNINSDTYYGKAMHAID